MALLNQNGPRSCVLKHDSRAEVPKPERFQAIFREILLAEHVDKLLENTVFAADFVQLQTCQWLVNESGSDVVRADLHRPWVQERFIFVHSLAIQVNPATKLPIRQLRC